MKKIFACASILAMSVSISAYAAPRIIDGYEQLQKALDQGDNVSAIIHFARCQKITSASVKDSYIDTSDETTRVNFNIYSHYKIKVDDKLKFIIATSNTILTETDKFSPLKKPEPVYAYGRLRIFEDNSAQFHTSYYDPKTYERKGGLDLQCHLGNGNLDGVVLLDTSA